MRRTLLVLAVITTIAVPATAQTRGPSPVQKPAPTRKPQPSERVFVSVDGVYQAATEDFSDSASFPLNAETATFSTTYGVKPGLAFNIAGSALVWQQLAVGIGVTRYNHETPVALTGSLPHPFFFNQPRSLSGDLDGFTRQELAVHVQARVLIPMAPNSKFQVMVFGGPSFFTVKQDVLTEVGYTESYPYDTVTVAPGTVTNQSVSKTGVNFGGDIGYFFTRQVGVGGTTQYAGTSIDLVTAGGDTVNVKVGGFQMGGGLRLRF